jgi:hypothetical protein
MSSLNSRYQDPFTSRVTKIDSEDYKNKTGLLAKAILPVNQIKEIYRTHTLSLSVYVTINITNASTNQSKVKIWVSDKTQPTLEDLYESGIILDPDAVYNRSFILLSRNEALFAVCDKADNVIRLDGFDDRPAA